MVKIAHASIDERGKISGGQAGNQNGKELCVRTWYLKPWNCVIRFKDPAMRQKVADCMLRAVNNPRIGYDQNQRNTLLAYARNVGYDPYKVTALCETDCSALVTLACIYAGVPEKALVINGNSATTSTLRRLLEATGMVEVFTGKEYTTSDKNLIVGDILLSEGHHVAVVVETDNTGEVNMGYSAEQIAFINKLAPLVQAECIKRGYKFASPILGQASKESFKGKGLSKLASQYNNFFGLKTGSKWTGKSVNLSTGEEYTKGVITQIQANFRVFDNAEDGVKGYFNFINTSRYENLHNATSPKDYLEKIVADKYCTSTTYVQGTMDRIISLNLTRFDNFAGLVPTGNPYPEPTKNIRLNSKGNDVRWLQWMLNDKGHYGLIVDGEAGDKTIEALTDFQKKAFPNEPKEWDGICGPLTRAALKK